MLLAIVLFSGICVPQEKCDTKIAAIPPPPPPIPGVDMCPINEKWKKCGCHCLELCENRNTPEICPIFKKEIGCFCIKGFYRYKSQINYQNIQYVRYKKNMEKTKTNSSFLKFEN